MEENNYDKRIKMAYNDGYKEGYMQALKDFKVKESFHMLLNPTTVIKMEEDKRLTEDEVRELMMGDGDIVYHVKELMESGYNLDDIKAVFIQLSFRLKGEINNG